MRKRGQHLGSVMSAENLVVVCTGVVKITRLEPSLVSLPYRLALSGFVASTRLRSHQPICAECPCAYSPSRNGTKSDSTLHAGTLRAKRFSIRRLSKDFYRQDDSNSQPRLVLCLSRLVHSLVATRRWIQLVKRVPSHVDNCERSV